jgi:hypothetical protein
MSSIASAAAPAAVAVSSDRLWLYHKRWDLTFIIGSSALAAVPLLLLHAFGVSTTALNLLVAGLVGGPHLYSTFGYTLAEPGYRRQQGWFLLPCLIIPVAVAWLAHFNLNLLITIFFFWASIHVLHQIAYLTDCYRMKDPRPRPLSSRLIDYGVIFSGLYVTATPRLLGGQFVVGGGTNPKKLLIPEFVLGQQWISVLVALTFATFLFLYVRKSLREHKEGRLNVPSVALISVATVMSLIIPLFPNIDIAFQGYNTWHSFQYLALVWYINKLRLEHGEITNGVMRTVSGRGHTLRFYGLFLLATLVAFGITLALQFGLGWGRDQAYYSVVLGTLLVHYYLDSFNFTRWSLVVREPTPGELARMSTARAEAA